MTLSLAIFAAVLLTAAGYAHYRIGFHTRGRTNLLLVRGALVLVGLALGYVSSAYYAPHQVDQLLAFLAGFGAVHVPAAVILFVKRARGAGRS